MAKRMTIVVIALVIVFGGIFGWKAFVAYETKKFLSHRKEPPVSVSATHARTDTWSPTFSAVGTLEAVHGVDVSSEVAGRIVKINFESGQSVKKGQLLVQLNDAPELAKLEGLKAQAEFARAQFDRDKNLLSKRGVSQSQYDQDRSNLDDARAAVANQQAMIDQKSIAAPFAGRLGIREVNLGQYLSPGTPIVTLQSLNPIYVNFTLPQQDLRDLNAGQPVEITVDSYDGKVFKGKITTISPKVDVNTRNVQVQATLENEGNLLRPGMFARVSVVRPQQQNVVTLPNTAITYNPYGDTVYLIKQTKGKDGKEVLTVHSQVVFTGATRGDQVAVTKGIKPGDWVVTAGQLKLHNGSQVVINNSVTPPDNPSPTPPNS